MKPVISDTMKASFHIVAGWTFTIWLIFYFASLIALITQA